MIDEQEILNLIATQLNKVIKNNEEVFDGYNFTISNELQFIKEKKKNNPKQIFIVVKFLQATINYGQVLMPILINAIAEKNKMDVCYRLLIEYAETYNLEFNNDETIKQYYSSPVVLSNFGEIGDGFRSLLTMSGTFQISENSNDFDVYYNGEKIPAISVNGSFDIQLESQAFYGAGDITTSNGKVGTFVVNITAYLDASELVNECIDVATNRVSVNTDFILDVKFKNGRKLSNTRFVLSNFTFEKNIGNLPVCTMTFTN